MSFAVGLLSDAMFEESIMILGVDEDHVAKLVVDYLRITRPLVAPSGSRMVLPETPGPQGWAQWLDEALTDVDDIGLTTWSTERGDLMQAGQFLDYIHLNKASLAKMHIPLVTDVVVKGDIL